LVVIRVCPKLGPPDIKDPVFAFLQRGGLLVQWVSKARPPTPVLVEKTKPLEDSLKVVKGPSRVAFDLREPAPVALFLREERVEPNLTKVRTKALQVSVRKWVREPVLAKQQNTLMQFGCGPENGSDNLLPEILEQSLGWPFDVRSVQTTG
jgi:hypothetical protein